MLSNKQLMMLELYCNALVLKMFALSISPEHRSKNFTWEAWPADVAELALAGVFSLFDIGVDRATLPDAEAYAHEYTLRLAKKTIEQAKLV